MRRGGRERERRALADVETMWKKQERVEEGARSLRSLLEYVNWHRHPDPSFNELSVNRMVTNCVIASTRDCITRI